MEMMPPTIACPKRESWLPQYLLLYELSLPFGLDLNDRINIDKSATRLTVTLPEISTARVRDFINRTEAWLPCPTPGYMWSQATGATVMFSYISQRKHREHAQG